MNASSASSLLGLMILPLALCFQSDVWGYINMERNGRQNEVCISCVFTARSDDYSAGTWSS
eukprot:16448330-Heterocapsa_arctica.AAC.1